MRAQNCKSKVSQSFFMMNIIQQQEKITIQESDKLEKKVNNTASKLQTI